MVGIQSQKTYRYYIKASSSLGRRKNVNERSGAVWGGQFQGQRGGGQCQGLCVLKRQAATPFGGEYKDS